MFKSSYKNALDDYQRARQSAEIQELLARLSGNPEDAALLSYDEVRHQLQATTKGSEQLAEIPLDAIVGSVNRYDDFTRKYLPKKNVDQGRWARVMASTQGLTGLPPIEVYQIGDVYFVNDGNHRVSVARQIGNQSIQAYITKVDTRVDLPLDIKPEGLIIKGEYVRFLEKTKLDLSVPDLDLSVTKPGAYPTLLEHIAVHRHYLGNDQQREIPFPEASEDWYKKVYRPVLDIIKGRDLLRDFPDRTSADLYLWAADHQAALRDQIGWDIGTEATLSDITDRYSLIRIPRIRRGIQRFLDNILPAILEGGPPPGTWRDKLLRKTVLKSLFTDLIVAIDDSPNAWHALEMAIMIARTENGQLHGVHVHPPTNQHDHQVQDHDLIKAKFEEKCQSAGIARFEFRVAQGEIWKILSEQSRFADLVIVPLNHPPSDKPSARRNSGIHSLIRSCPVPVMTVPGATQTLQKVVLAYDGSLKSREALFVAAYLGTQMGSTLSVIVSQTGLTEPEKVLTEARDYLNQFPMEVDYLLSSEDLSPAISKLLEQASYDLVLMGGYRGSTLIPIMFGSVVDQVLREIPLPVLICR